MKIIIVILFVLISIKITAQNSSTNEKKITLSGFIKDSLTGEAIIESSIYLNSKNIGITTNQFGYYSITLLPGKYTFLVSHISYISQIVEIELNKNTFINFNLISKASTSNNVTVYSKRRDGNVKNAQMGKIDLSADVLKSIPVLLGEVDIIKTLQLLPGIQKAGEGNAGLYVRGGGPDQNLIMLDDAIVYNTGHLFGFFSIFNADAIKNVTLIKGGMPAQYGGRLSSVLDVTMKEGNLNKLQVDGGIGLIASRFSIQGPIKNKKASFIISARRTYVDVISKPFISKSSGFKGSGYYFYDLNAKVNYILNNKNRVYVSVYFGKDDFTYKNLGRNFNANITWGNSTATLRWNHVFNPKLFNNTTLVYNHYHFEFSALQQNFLIQLSSGIRDVNFKTDFDFYPKPDHKLKFGAISTYHKCVPNVLNGNQDSVVFKPNHAFIKYALETAFYIQDDWSIKQKIVINYGLRFSQYTQLGPYTLYQVDANQNPIDSVLYKNFKSIKTYNGFEPRATLRYLISNQSSLKFSISKNYQYLHLVSNSTTTLPTDLWVPSTYLVKPQVSWLFSSGFFKNFNNNMYESSIELYYKKMQNQIEFGEGYQPSLDDQERHFVFGKGWSYGAELFLHKVMGKLTGWFGYTFSYTFKKFDALNNGEKFYAKYDRRHDLSLVTNYVLNNKWKLGSVFVYATGSAFSLPERFYFISGVLNQDFSSINKYRLPAYHRLDLSATYSPVPKKVHQFKSTFTFSIYNVYNRFNPYFLYFNQTGSINTGNLKIEARKVALFPILPSATWNFNF